MNYFVKRNDAFTLIELMVTITIIALMFGIVISSANFLRSTSGDAKRKADLAELQSALQNYYADLNYFPHSGTGGFKLNGSGASTNLTSAIGITSPAPSPAPPLKTYLKTVPVDTTNSYCYVAVRNASLPPNTDCDNTAAKRCNFYYLSVRLDNNSSPQTIPTEVQCAGVNANYMVTP